MKKEKSCGAIVYRRKDYADEILLVKHKNGGHWSFPKGHVEAGEDEKQTALREILEETGLVVDLDTSFREVITYSPKKGVEKDVVFFAALPREGEPVAQPEEIMEVLWVKSNEALKMVTYESDREMLKKFLDRLS